MYILIKIHIFCISRFFRVFGSGLQFFGFGSGLSYFFRVWVGFGLVKNPRVGSGSRVFGYPTHHYAFLTSNYFIRSNKIIRTKWQNY